MKRKISIFVAVIAAVAMMSFTLMGNTGNDDAKEPNGKNSCIVVVKYSSDSPASSVRVVGSVCGGISCSGNTKAVYTDSNGKATIYWSEGCKLCYIYIDGKEYKGSYSHGGSYNFKK